MKLKTTAIILGNRLNDDGSISKYQEERLEMALEIEELFKPDYFILTGGVANPLAIISEADAMYDYLVNKGIEKERLIKEDQSHSTYENALYSLPIVKKLGAELVIVCTSDYHLARSEYSAMSSFINQLDDSKLALIGGFGGQNEATISNCYYLCDNVELFSFGHSNVLIDINKITENDLLNLDSKLSDSFKYSDELGYPILVGGNNNE